jgi:hypothetical protein
MQEMFEYQKSIDRHQEPTLLVDELAEIINSMKIDQIKLNHNIFFKYKNEIPFTQLLSLYAINKISTIANEN